VSDRWPAQSRPRPIRALALFVRLESAYSSTFASHKKSRTNRSGEAGLHPASGRELDVDVGEVDLRGERGERAGDDAGGKSEQTDRGQFLPHRCPRKALRSHCGRPIATSPDPFLVLLRGMDLAWRGFGVAWIWRPAFPAVQIV
jgi:hypothetical protein